MSDEEEEDNEEEEEEEQEEEEEEEEEEEQEQQQNEDEQNQDDEEQQNQQQNQEQEQSNEKLPKFKAIQTEQFKFHSLLSEISNLSLSVDHLIDSFPSRGTRGTFSREARDRDRQRDRDRLEERQDKFQQRQSRVVVMKDEDVQVSMQPQIVIQPTKLAQQKTEYRISNESNKFLAQLYEQNKRLKRWQGGALAGSGFPTSGSGFYNPREKFERKDYEKGLFDVEGRNKEIDRAIELLKREE